MCLLVEQTAKTSFSDEFLADVYSKNKDGLGIMYAENGIVVVQKIVPTSSAEFIEFYRQYAEGRDCIWHARMQTHGDIDLDNCHPYYVTDELWMAHNGVLSSGNDNNPAKSDTWHFIRNVIQPAIEGNKYLVHDPEWQAFIGDLIGSTNKFGFMTGDGSTVIINRKSGVEFNGAWLSNTYAWTPSKFGFQTQSKSTYGGGYNKYAYGNYWHQYDWEAEYESYSTVSKSSAKKDVTVKRESKESIRSIIRAAQNCYLRDTLEQWVVDAPWKASALIAYCYDDEQGAEELVADDPAKAVEWIRDLFETDGLTPFNASFDDDGMVAYG